MTDVDTLATVDGPGRPATSPIARSRRNTELALLVMAVLITGAALVYGTVDMPAFGDPNAPAQRYPSPTYVEKAAEEIHVPNVVTAVLGSYRGYDTLGETVVIFTAGIGVLLLLRGRTRSKEDSS